MRSALPITCLFIILTGLISCSRGPDPEDLRKPAAAKEVTPTPAVVPAVTPPDVDLSRLFGRIWRISSAPSTPASGSIYVFLPNGTLLQTSCVETYRIATWAVDKSLPGVLQITEDGRPAFSAKLGESTDKTLRLRQTLLLGSQETRDLALTAVDAEFVCPDIPK